MIFLFLGVYFKMMNMPFRLPIFLTAVFVLLFLFFSCSMGEDLMDMVGGEAKSSSQDKMKYMEEPAAEQSGAPAPSAKRGAPAEAEPEADMAKETAASAAETKKEQEERKRIYSGTAKLQVDDVEEAKNSIADIAENAGGYIERSYENYIQVRVPADSFKNIFQAILNTGDVLHSAVEAQDVTEFYQDLQTRLEISRKARERLYILLERTEDVEERVKILREIRRLTEEIERINRTFTMLKEFIAYSRISVELVSRLEQTGLGDHIIPFPWIARLAPLKPAFSEAKGKVSLSLPDSFAVFEKGDYFSAENTRGVRIRVSSGKNNPIGDGPFWQEALAFHLAPYYKNMEKVNIEGSEKDLRGVLLTSKDRKPFFYLVAVRVEEKDLYVAEVFFPDGTTYEADYQSVVKALKDMTL